MPSIFPAFVYRTDDARVERVIGFGDIAPEMLFINCEEVDKLEQGRKKFENAVFEAICNGRIYSIRVRDLLELKEFTGKPVCYRIPVSKTTVRPISQEYGDYSEWNSLFDRLSPEEQKNLISLAKELIEKGRKSRVEFD